MHQLIFFCFMLASFPCPLISHPIADSSEVSYQLPDSKLDFGDLSSLDQAYLLQNLPAIPGKHRLGDNVDEYFSKEGLSLSTYNMDDSFKEMFLLRFATSDYANLMGAGLWIFDGRKMLFMYILYFKVTKKYIPNAIWTFQFSPSAWTLYGYISTITVLSWQRFTKLPLFQYIQQGLFGKQPRISLLNRLQSKDKKQYKKRGSLSECFWKYCV